MSPAKEKEKHRNMRLHGKWSRRSANNILININDDELASELAFSLFIGVGYTHVQRSCIVSIQRISAIFLLCFKITDDTEQQVFISSTPSIPPTGSILVLFFL